MFARKKFSTGWTVLSVAIAVLSAGCGTSTPHVSVTHHASPSSSSAAPTTSPSTAPYLSAGKLPILVPADLKAKSTLSSSSSSGTYDVTVLTDSGAKITFGGQQYASARAARQALMQTLIVSPGPGVGDPLGSGTVARKYANQRLITWTAGHWIIEVSGSSGTKVSMLEAPAKSIAELLHGIVLPPTPRGILHWETATHHAAITLAWVKGSAVYHLIQPHAANPDAAVNMAISMQPVP